MISHKTWPIGSRVAIVALVILAASAVGGQWNGATASDAELQKLLSILDDLDRADQEEEERERLLSLSDDELLSEAEKIARHHGEFALNRFMSKLGENRLKSLPMPSLFNLFVQEIDYEQATRLAFFQLQKLAYPPSTEGVKQFQADIGAEPTGILTFGQFQTIQIRLARLNETIVFPGGSGSLNVRIFKMDDYASVQGTWVLEDDEIAFPINLSKIECRRSGKYCIVSQAELNIPKFGEEKDSYHLHLRTTMYDIVDWKKSEIVAESAGECLTSTLYINSEANEVFEFVRNNTSEDCGLASLPPISKPQVARLMPGFDIAKNWWDNRKEMAREFINPRAMDLFDHQ